jgi:hypothetical protein
MDRQQGVALQLGGWAWGYNPLTVKNKLFTKTSKEPRIWSSCEFGIEPSGSMKCWETIEWPNI